MEGTWRHVTALTPPSSSSCTLENGSELRGNLTVACLQELLCNVMDLGFRCADRLPERLPQRQIGLWGGIGDMHVGGACTTSTSESYKSKQTLYQLRHDSGQHQHSGARRCCGGESCLPWSWRSSPAPMRLAGKFDAPAWLHHLELYLNINSLRPSE